MSQQVLDDYLMLVRKLENHEPFAFGHYNDGEMCYILTDRRVPISRGDQCYDDSLKQKLTETLVMDLPNFYRGMPCVKCFESMHQQGFQMVDAHRANGANIPTVTACVFHHNYAVRRDQMLRTFSSYPRITWITNDAFNLESVRNHIMNLRSGGDNVSSTEHRHLMVPRHNGWPAYEEMSKTEYIDGELVVLLCGPMGRVLAGEGFQKWPRTTFLCLGSYFDNMAGLATHCYHNSDRLCDTCCPP